jgi:glyoxylase-like metal-dependent hydrolase (beta-lactamase superfamily II)
MRRRLRLALRDGLLSSSSCSFPTLRWDRRGQLPGRRVVLVAVMVQVSAHCWVRQSEFCQSNSVIVTGDEGVLAVDPGVTGAELTMLSQELRALGLNPTLGFTTHPHWDHMLWARHLGQAPRWATARAVDHAHAHVADARAKATRLAPGNETELIGQLTALPVGTDTLEWAGPVVEILEHNGHAPGHAALYLPGDGVLIAGDMLSDVEVPLLDLKSGAPDPLSDYEEGLTRLEHVQGRGCRVVIPGHGAVGTGEDIGTRFVQDWSYLQALRRTDPVHDPRLDPDTTYGPDWLIPEHNAQRAWCLRDRST